jgi:hypothetical protein
LILTTVDCGTTTAKYGVSFNEDETKMTFATPGDSCSSRSTVTVGTWDKFVP